MSLRLTTTDANATSASWEPVGETIVQADLSDETSVTLVVEARVNPDADFATVTSVNLSHERFVRLAQLPEIRVKIQGNSNGGVVRVYDNE